jgi:hypothetical protein
LTQDAKWDFRTANDSSAHRVIGKDNSSFQYSQRGMLQESSYAAYTNRKTDHIRGKALADSVGLNPYHGTDL